MYNGEAADPEINFLVFPKWTLPGFIQSFNKCLASIYYKVGSVLGIWIISQGLYWKILYIV